jgi:hypothetical protein
MKKLCAVAVLALSTLTMVSAKSYSVQFAKPTKAGSVELKPGVYSLKVQGDKAVFTDQESQKQYTVPVKVETGERSYSETMVQSKQVGTGAAVQEIDLGGTKTKLGF